MQGAEKARLETELEQLRAQASEKFRLEAELNAAHLQAADKRRLEYELEHHKNMSYDKDHRTETELQMLRSQAADTQRLQAELAAETAERSRLESELEFAKTQAQNVSQQLNMERQALQGEGETRRVSYMKQMEETQAKLEDERKMHSSTLEEEKNRLLDKERHAAVWEGKVQALTEENKMLHTKLDTLQQQARQADAHKATADKLTQDLEAQKASTTEKLQEQAADYERRLAQDAPKGKKKAKCGCTVM
jgi:hypothetical protein